MQKEEVVTEHIIELIIAKIKQLLGTDNGPQFKFFLDMMFGLLKSSSVVLSDIGHALNEDDKDLIQIVKRLSKNLVKKINASVKHKHIEQGLNLMGDEKVFLVDDSDVVKPYGKKFESMSTVRDGSASSSQKKTYSLGYQITSIVGVTAKRQHPIALYDRVHSSTEKNFLSVNNITNEGVKMICEHLKPFEGTFVFDRGYDDRKLMMLLIESKQYFIVRGRKNRKIHVKSRESNIMTEAARHKGRVRIDTRIKGQPCVIKASHVTGKIGDIKQPLSVVFAYLDDNSEPAVFYTNSQIKSRDNLIRVVLHYHSRWKIEELFRFKKVEFKIENFRTKALVSINNLFFLADYAVFILAIIIERSETNMLFRQLIGKSNAIREDVYLQYYRLLSGVKWYFGTNKKGVKNYKKIRKEKSRQLSFKF